MENTSKENQGIEIGFNDSEIMKLAFCDDDQTTSKIKPEKIISEKKKNSVDTKKKITIEKIKKTEKDKDNDVKLAKKRQDKKKKKNEDQIEASQIKTETGISVSKIEPPKKDETKKLKVEQKKAGKAKKDEGEIKETETTVKEEKADKKEKKQKKKEENKESVIKLTEKVKVDEKKGISKDLEEDEKEVLDYMIKQYRPYSLLNIYDNLHAKIKKKRLEMILDSLTKKGELLVKEYASNVYLASEKHYPRMDENELKAIDEKLEEKNKIYTEKNSLLKKLQNELKSLKNTLTDEQIIAQIEEKKKILELNKIKLKRYEVADFVKVSDEEVRMKENLIEEKRKAYKKAKKICIDIVDQFVENMERKRNELFEDIGIENDDEEDLNNLNLKL